MKDELFKNEPLKQFEFDASVASVFDDMIDRSVPFYKQNLSLIAQLLAKSLNENAKVCDLGCSSANLLIKLHSLRKDLELFGIDESEAMLEIAMKKCKAYGINASFFNANLSEFEFFNTNAFIATYTLQFIRPPKRQALVNEIYNNLNTGGIFILSEKIIYENPSLAKKMIEIYANFKQGQGYSEFEIASKREALENVLVPYSEKENVNMLLNAGFKVVESIFKWANFQSFIAIKD